MILDTTEFWSKDASVIEDQSWDLAYSLTCEIANMHVVTIPIYKPQPNAVERFNLAVSLSVLGEDTPIVLLIPQGLDVSEYVTMAPSAIKLEVDPGYFRSISTYSQLCLQPSLYRALAHFDYVLLLQPDAILLRNDLRQWADLGYAYIGAPIGVAINVLDKGLLDGLGENTVAFTHFVPGTVGNGGFSLRKVSATIDVLERHASVARRFALQGLSEDLFYAACAVFDPAFRVPTPLEAARFSIEMHGPQFMEVTRQIPVGLHAWDRYDTHYWLQIFALLGFKPPIVPAKVQP